MTMELGNSSQSGNSNSTVALVDDDLSLGSWSGCCLQDMIPTALGGSSTIPYSEYPEQRKLLDYVKSLGGQ
eukprot:jgi/Chrzof1/7711/Cz02g33240.t1